MQLLRIFKQVMEFTGNGDNMGAEERRNKLARWGQYGNVARIYGPRHRKWRREEINWSLHMGVGPA